VNVPVRVVTQREDEMLAVYVAVSGRPVHGPRTGLPFRLTQERFLLIQEGIRAALERRLGREVISGEWQDMSVSVTAGETSVRSSFSHRSRADSGAERVSAARGTPTRP
jgi:hypothetical protein